MATPMVHSTGAHATRPLRVNFSPSKAQSKLSQLMDARRSPLSFAYPTAEMVTDLSALIAQTIGGHRRKYCFISEDSLSAVNHSGDLSLLFLLRLLMLSLPRKKGLLWTPLTSNVGNAGAQEIPNPLLDRLLSKKSLMTDKPFRELAVHPPEFGKNKPLEGAYNGSWVRGLESIPNGQWFARDDDKLKIDVLKGHTGGVYEIGLWPHADLPPESPQAICVYVGRATKVRDDAKGQTLRSRIFSEYCRNGSHLANQLREYLKEGFDVYFRWRTFDLVTAAIEYEILLLDSFNYAFNSSRNGLVRGVMNWNADALVTDSKQKDALLLEFFGLNQTLDDTEIDKVPVMHDVLEFHRLDRSRAALRSAWARDLFKVIAPDASDPEQRAPTEFPFDKLIKQLVNNLPKASKDLYDVKTRIAQVQRLLIYAQKMIESGDE